MPDLSKFNSLELERVESGITGPCCPELDPDKGSDYLDFHYRLKYPKTVKIDNETRVVTVEVLIAARLERTQDKLSLGDLLYSTTLLPGEKVRLFTMDRHSRFSFDKESSLSYRHAQSSHNRSVQATRINNFVSIGEVQTRTHSRGRNRRSFWVQLTSF